MKTKKQSPNYKKLYKKAIQEKKTLLELLEMQRVNAQVANKHADAVTKELLARLAAEI